MKKENDQMNAIKHADKEIREEKIRSVVRYIADHDYGVASQILADMLQELEVSAESSELDYYERGGRMYAGYDIEVKVGHAQFVATGWYRCDWLKKGASQEVDGSPTTLWGDNQPGNWSVSDEDPPYSGVITVVPYSRDSWLLRLSGGYNEDTVEIDLLKILGFDEKLADAVSEAITCDTTIVDRIRTAIKAAKPECVEPSDQEIYDCLDEVEGLPGVRVGRFPGSTAVWAGIDKGCGLVVERVHSPDDLSGSLERKILQITRDILASTIKGYLEEER